MPAAAKQQLSQFAREVAAGLSQEGQKKLQPHYFYDDLGSALFEAITLLPEYGLTRADERILRRHSPEIGHLTGSLDYVAELGSGSGKKTAHILRALPANLLYRPIDVSRAALAFCEKELNEEAEIRPLCADWLDGLAQLASSRAPGRPLLVLFLGSSIGNLERHALPRFFQQLHTLLLPGDFFLLGADLVKDVDKMLAAYDDPVGVTAAFNRNLLSRINRELHANFDLRYFAHEVRWSAAERRIEMHLLSCRDQRVFIDALHTAFAFEAGETIWTESSHKFTELELEEYALGAGFRMVQTWIDNEWPFAETLWKVE